MTTSNIDNTNDRIFNVMSRRCIKNLPHMQDVWADSGYLPCHKIFADGEIDPRLPKDQWPKKFLLCEAVLLVRAGQLPPTPDENIVSVQEVSREQTRDA